MEASRAALRIAWGAKYLQSRRADARVRLVHCVVSVHADAGDYETCRAMAYRISRLHGLDGGACIFHPWREDSDTKEYAPDGYWHYHIVGINFGNISPGGTDFLEDGRRIIFRHIRDDEYGDFGGLRSGRGIERLLQYLLTHAGLADGAHAITYFGSLAYNKLPRAEVHQVFPEALDEHSRTNPRVPVQCPLDGSRNTEPCEQMDGWMLMPVHAPPEYEPSPEAIAKARRSLEEEYEFRYQCAGTREERHALTEERQRERAKLAQEETELFNLRHPLVAIWRWLKAVLSEGSVPINYLEADDQELLWRCIDLNLASGRLGMTKGERLYLIREYGLDDALSEVRSIVFSGESKDGHDWRLERLIAKNPPRDNPIMTDTGFVFGELYHPYNSEDGDA